MIVDFTIENFRSVKEEQLLSLYAENKPKYHAGNISYFKDNLGILKTCAIYGSNAAGKTNLLLAFQALVDLITNSSDWKDGDPIKCYEPYLLSNNSHQNPTRFELEFYIEEIRYVYEISYNKFDILYEKLDFYPNSRIANLFTRNSAKDWKKVKFGEYYKSGKKQIAFFSNNTYISKAGNTADSPEVARKIFNYFRKNALTMLIHETIGVMDWDSDKNTVSIMNTFLKKIDLGINKFEIKKDNIDLSLPINMPKNIHEMFLAELSKKEYFYHETENGDLVKFEKNKESNGTNRIFKLLPFLIKVLREGSVLFIDEIERSFHPHIAELIIKLFNDPLVNMKNAQLIFTTHDLTLMSPQTMRKDQIYLVSKNIKHGTQLNSLDSYDSTLKNNSPFSKWYNEGRLGAIPKIDYRDISDSIKKAFQNA